MALALVRNVLEGLTGGWERLGDERSYGGGRS